MLDIIIIAGVLLLLVITVTVMVAYINVIKNGKSYVRRRVQNGDIYFDDVCSSKHLKLTNLHVACGVIRNKGGDNIEEGNM